ncbi:hypothetical protein [Geovibrio ferrireducens]|uniref:hypothetical protein n=1 Tax=Geovibrio ferrireducens TaxID=46201 RepID=UPI002246E517|nr:hypothetical protein [Geovibrio ferrireducens]
MENIALLLSILVALITIGGVLFRIASGVASIKISVLELDKSVTATYATKEDLKDHADKTREDIRGLHKRIDSIKGGRHENS